MTMPSVALSSGKPMPRIGFGMATATLGQAEGHAAVKEAVLRALDAGYRRFDTAAVYNTEAALGDALAEAVCAGKIASRDEVFVTSKLWIADAHPGRVLQALQKTLNNLQMEYVDLYLIHQPISMRPQAAEGGPLVVKEDLVAMDMKGVWKEMEECQRRGMAKAIGVSNFSCKKLEYLLSVANIPPAANQVEVHPYCRQNKLRDFCREKGIQLCAYSPLGGKGTPWGNASVMDSPVLKQIALNRGKTIAQVNFILEGEPPGLQCRDYSIKDHPVSLLPYLPCCQDEDIHEVRSCESRLRCLDHWEKLKVCVPFHADVSPASCTEWTLEEQVVGCLLQSRRAYAATVVIPLYSNFLPM